ncbi:MAG TPA: hypothetical protein VHJ20_06235, partial [Polyangia bacterium]|nr:hypothetical protein [Polyangia bacterium]
MVRGLYSMDIDTALEELFVVAPDAFVEARTRLAAALAAAGRKDDARELKKMKRPSFAAWATNALVREARGAVERYLAASDELRRAQAAALGGEAGVSVSSSLEGFREAGAALSREANALIKRAGRGDDRRVVDQIVANARAAARDEGRRATLLASRVVEDAPLAQDGVGGLGGLGGLGDVGEATLAAFASAPPPRASVTARAPVPRGPSPEQAARLAEARRAEEAAVAEATRAGEAASAAEATRDEARARLTAAER